MRHQRVFERITLPLAASLLILGLSGIARAASTSATAVPDYYPNDVIEHSVYYQLQQATALIDKGDCAGAMPKLKEAASIEPGNVFVSANMGYCYMQMANAETDQQQAQADLGKAEEAYMRIQYVAPDLTSTYFKLGRIAILEGDMKKAIDYYLTGLEEEPDNAALTFNIARAYDQQEDYDHAVMYYQKSLQLDPDFVYAYNNLGLIYESQGKMADAETVYKQALAHDAHYAFARLNLGNLYAETHRSDAAMAQYNQVLKEDPKNPWAHLYMGNMYFAQEDYDHALEQYSEATKENPDYENTYYLMAVTLSHLQRTDDAMAAGMHYLSAAPDGEYAQQVRDLLLTLKLHQAGVFFIKGQATAGAPASSDPVGGSAK